jgi:2'-5' RNA ligase
MPTARLFTAIDLATETRQELVACARALGPALAGVRWVAPEALHLTLCFLGDVPAERLEGLVAALAAGVAGQGPFACGLRGLGVFPDPRRPTVLWAGVTAGAQSLADLAERLRRQARALDVAVDSRAFAAHVTLGRFRRGTRLRAALLEGLLSRWAETRFGQFTADQVTLYSSVLTPAGPQYDPVCRWRLGPGPRAEPAA